MSRTKHSRPEPTDDEKRIMDALIIAHEDAIVQERDAAIEELRDDYDREGER